jgi:vacuolar-type H+-ATPase subunit E/Vma4
MKKEIRQNLIELEKAKMISSSNHYQIIISRIAQDIRSQRKHRQRRQRELAHLKEVQKVLEKKHNLLKEQVSYYNEYVKACLDSLNSKKGFEKLFFLFIISIFTIFIKMKII